jgi:hypothetical protein
LAPPIALGTKYDVNFPPVSAKFIGFNVRVATALHFAIHEISFMGPNIL